MAEQTAEIPAIQPIHRLDFFDIRLIFFIAAMIAYGIGSSPTPDAIGGAEIFTGLSLIIAAGGWKAAHVLFNGPHAAWVRAGQALLLYGLTIPIMTSVIAGHSPGGTIRDLIAFLFLLLPLFMYGLCVRKQSYRRPLTAAVAIIGILFSLRVLSPVFILETGPVWYIQPPADPFYLANAPTVIFAALILAGMAGKIIYTSPRLKNFGMAAIFVTLAFFPLAAMALITQRASMGILALSTLLLTGIAVCRQPLRAITPVAILVLMAYAGWDTLHFFSGEAARKTAAVGLNMRWAEAMAVLNDLASTSLPAVIFGKGWGATIASPAVGGVTVNFTHSLLTTYWLKTGLIGLLLALNYILHIVKNLWQMLFYNPIMALALAGPLTIDILLYASFKSLDFGLVLLLVPIWSTSTPAVASQSRSL